FLLTFYEGDWKEYYFDEFFGEPDTAHHFWLKMAAAGTGLACYALAAFVLWGATWRRVPPPTGGETGGAARTADPRGGPRRLGWRGWGCGASRPPAGGGGGGGGGGDGFSPGWPFPSPLTPLPPGERGKSSERNHPCRTATPRVAADSPCSGRCCSTTWSARAG